MNANLILEDKRIVIRTKKGETLYSNNVSAEHVRLVQATLVWTAQRNVDEELVEELWESGVLVSMSPLVNPHLRKGDSLSMRTLLSVV